MRIDVIALDLTLHRLMSVFDGYCVGQVSDISLDGTVMMRDI